MRKYEPISRASDGVDNSKSSTIDGLENTQVTKLPMLEMLCLCAVQLNEACQINVLFPFLVFMIESFGYDGNSLGIHAGILAGCFCGAQFFSSMFWGMMSDKIGLKPCLVIGTLGGSAVFIFFGFSSNFYQAVAARSLAGLLNGNIGVLKSFVAKITDDTNRSRGFSLLSVSWGECLFQIRKTGC